MTLYHFSDTVFESFDSSYLGSHTTAQNSDDENTLAICSLGFCFVEDCDLETMTRAYGEDYAAHLAECEVEASENYDTTWEDLCSWINECGIETVRETLENDGVDYIQAWNGIFNEIIILNPEAIKIQNWIK